MKVKNYLFVAFTIVLSSVANPSWADEFERGYQAYSDKDFSLALEIWQPLAREGHPQAQYGLGIMNEYGRGLSPNDGEASRWYRLAAKQGIPDAQYRLGVFYEHGWGIDADPEKAVAWYKLAAELDHAFAQHDLAFMYLTGTGIPPDKVQAYKWLKIAATLRADLMTKHLEFVSEKMSQEEIEQAEILAARWLRGQ